MSYPQLLRLLARLDLVDAAADQARADLACAGLDREDLDALEQLERSARRN